MKILPQENNCLIKIEKIETKAGIILPSESDNIIIEKAEIVAIGEKVKRIKVGDRIMFKSWNLDTVEIEDEKYPFIEEKNILAVIK